MRRFTAEAAHAIAPLIAAEIDDEHRLTLAHSLVGLSEGASRQLVERGEHFDPDKVADQLSAFAWAGLRGITQPVGTALSDGGSPSFWLSSVSGFGDPRQPDRLMRTEGQPDPRDNQIEGTQSRAADGQSAVAVSEAGRGGGGAHPVDLRRLQQPRSR